MIVSAGQNWERLEKEYLHPDWTYDDKIEWRVSKEVIYPPVKGF